MHRILIFILFLMLSINFSLFSQSKRESSSKASLGSEVSTSQQKEDTNQIIFNMSKRSIASPVTLSMILPFGIGSYIQGDFETAVIVTFMDFISLSTLLSGIFLPNLNKSKVQEINIFSYLLTGIGVLGIIGSKVLSIFKIIEWTNNFNRELAVKLNLAFGIPFVNVSESLFIDKKLGFSIGFNKRF